MNAKSREKKQRAWNSILCRCKWNKSMAKFQNFCGRITVQLRRLQQVVRNASLRHKEVRSCRWKEQARGVFLGNPKCLHNKHGGFRCATNTSTLLEYLTVCWVNAKWNKDPFFAIVYYNVREGAKREMGNTQNLRPDAKKNKRCHWLLISLMEEWLLE